MAEASKEDQSIEDSSSPTQPRQAPKDLEAALTLLKKKDDTSRFVGLALLKPVLEQELSSNDSANDGERDALVQRCWDAVPANFLDRLLKARASETRTKEEANNMVGLAVAVIHAFMSLLQSPPADEKFMRQVSTFMSTLRGCPQQTRTLIMAIFHTLAMTPEGSAAIFNPRMKGGDLDQKPESYLFITMLLIDIRSSIPSLQEKLHSDDYSATSDRLGKAYDIISAFIGFLIQSLEMMSGDAPADFVSSSPMPVDLLLKLRTNISETMSLTIEHLRDRYDSSTAGAAGLHPSARSTIDQSSPLPIAWDTSSGMFEDPLTLSQLRTLSLWLRDEENDALRREAAGITEVLLALYQQDGAQDFRLPVLVALEGIIECVQGVEAFLQEGGWSPLALDLTNILQQSSNNSALGIEIIRILLAIVESDISGQPKEDWMSLIISAKDHLTPTTQSSALELPIAVAQIAVELLTRTPRGPRKKYQGRARDVLATAEGLLTREDLEAGDREGLEELVDGLSGLGFQ